jgi:modification methylase
MYQIEEIKNKIICGDVLEILKKIPDESVDLVLTDPPYNISQKNEVKNENKDNTR